MSWHITRLLQRNDAVALAASLKDAAFVDGRATAGGKTNKVKANLQFTDLDPAYPPFGKRALQLFGQSEEFRAFTYPARILNPIFSRYEPGMHYGDHVDAATMGWPAPLRTDLSTTLFLSPPESYDGGELVVRFPTGTERIKLDAGEAVIYPSSTVHHVAPVTRGARIAVVTWVESLVRDPAMRQILIDLNKVHAAIKRAGNDELALVLNNCVHNLIRHVAKS